MYRQVAAASVQAGCFCQCTDRLLLPVYVRGSSFSNYIEKRLKRPMYEYQVEACSQTLILLKFIDISDFLILHFGAMNLLLFIVG